MKKCKDCEKRKTTDFWVNFIMLIIIIFLFFAVGLSYGIAEANTVILLWLLLDSMMRFK